MKTGPSAAPLLQIRDLCVDFHQETGTVRVLYDIDLDVHSGETLGLVGESGCGKSITALSIMRLLPTPPAQISHGRILLAGNDLLSLSEKRLRQLRGSEMSMVFQEPMTSLNPAFTVGNQLVETIRLHEHASRRDALDKAVQMLKAVGIPAPAQRVREYPHQLSGGMRQRVMIAIALACNPKLLIADEPTTALDVTVQAQIFELLQTLQAETQIGLILITHDIGAVAEMADRVAVMYAGYKVEEGPVDAVVNHAGHPYTQALLKSAPHLSTDTDKSPDELPELPGIVPALHERLTGCPFAPRCAYAMDICRRDMPTATHIGPQHSVACWLANDANMVATS